MEDRQTNRHRHLKQQILPVARKAFSLHGIKAVKMDDIASYLKISKRTLYETYQNKEELLFDVLVDSYKEWDTKMELFAKQTDDIMDLLLEFLRLHTEMYANTNPLFFSELSRYAGLSERFKVIRGKDEIRYKEFFAKGTEEGYFRDDVNYGLIVKISRDMHMLFRTEDDYKSYGMREIFLSFVCSLLRGVCTEKGIKRIDAFLKVPSSSGLNSESGS